MIDWVHAGPAVTAAFLGSLVECVEAVTIILAVGTVRGWRSALLGTAAGRLALHDEERAFEGATAALTTPEGAMASRWDTVALVTTFKAVVLEGLEVVFIVLAVGAAGHVLVPASVGAAGAAIAVALAAWALRRPLAAVPENALKLSVGVLIASFGAFWLGEGLGFHWPGGDVAILGLAGACLAMSLLATTILRTPDVPRWERR